MSGRIEIGRVGVWVGGAPDAELAAGLDELGYGAIWIGSSPGGDLGEVERILAATSRIAVATGIVNVWRDDAADIAAAFHRLADSYPGRFLLGIGAGHPEATSDYTKPYDALVRYLDGLDAGGVPKDQRVLAALGPKVLRLAGERTAGAHPYLVTPEHTRRARELLGSDPLLAPEQHVVLDADVARARALARTALGTYLGLRNYTSNWRRLGFTDADLADGGSDRLIDSVVALGDASRIAARVTEHLQAGADHVCIQLISPRDQDKLAAFAELAAQLPT
ncbi:MAG TPA: LLM class F420-dependent oxidoreductase [Jatrophihabitantaceae bacterium]|jgi:probable F420-dependent oxidoreductase